MKFHKYKIHFESGEVIEEHAASAFNALIKALAKRIEGGLSHIVTKIVEVDDGFIWYDPSLNFSHTERTHNY
jgi:hypothetical protein